jgi:uncharacterized protein
VPGRSGPNRSDETAPLDAQPSALGDDVVTNDIRSLTLDLVPGSFAICRWPSGDSLPRWVMEGTFFSVTRTPTELSAVCAAAAVPPGVKAEGPWSVLAVRGPLDLNLTGVLAGLATSLAAAGISIFAVSTYDTDYVLVRNHDLDRAVRVLRDAGHHIPQGE